MNGNGPGSAITRPGMYACQQHSPPFGPYYWRFRNGDCFWNCAHYFQDPQRRICCWAYVGPIEDDDDKLERR